MARRGEGDRSSASSLSLKFKNATDPLACVSPCVTVDTDFLYWRTTDGHAIWGLLAP